jgi:hypothetical protein
VECGASHRRSAGGVYGMRLQHATSALSRFRPACRVLCSSPEAASTLPGRRRSASTATSAAWTGGRSLKKSPNATAAILYGARESRLISAMRLRSSASACSTRSRVYLGRFERRDFFSRQCGHPVVTLGRFDVAAVAKLQSRAWHLLRLF